MFVGVRLEQRVAQARLIGLEGNGVRGRTDDVALGDERARTEQTLHNEERQLGRDVLAPRVAGRVAGQERASGHALLERLLLVEGFGDGETAFGKIGRRFGGDVALFLTVETEDFPLARKRLQHLVEPFGVKVGQHGKLGEVRSPVAGKLDLGAHTVFVGGQALSELWAE